MVVPGKSVAVAAFRETDGTRDAFRADSPGYERLELASLRVCLIKVCVQGAP